MQTADDTLATTDLRGAGATPLALDRYRLVRRLGAGAFGVVWLAHDERLDRVVAVKRIDLHDEHVAARAEREALAAARLQHPGIVALYEAGRDADAVYLVSELVRGRTLAELTDEGALSDRDVLRIGVALCDALEHAHARGVVHRDVKPANIMISGRSRRTRRAIAKLTDFGVAAHRRRRGADPHRRRRRDARLHGAGAGRGPRGRRARRPLRARARPLRGALRRQPRARRRRRRDRAPRRRRACRRWRGCAATCRASVCAAIDRAVLPRPHERGTLAELRAALDSGLDGAARSPGTVAGPAGERRAPMAPQPFAPAAVHELQDAPPAPPRSAPAITQRAVAAAATAALVAAVITAAPATFAPGPGAALAGAAATALVVLALPRLGWMAAAGAVVAWLVAAGLPGAAVLVAAAAIPTMVLLPRDGVLLERARAGAAAGPRRPRPRLARARRPGAGLRRSVPRSARSASGGS